VSRSWVRRITVVVSVGQDTHCGHPPDQAVLVQRQTRRKTLLATNFFDESILLHLECVVYLPYVTQVHVAAASAGHFTLRLRCVPQIRQDRTVFHSHMAKDGEGISLPAVAGTPVSADSAGIAANHRLIGKCMASVKFHDPLYHSLHADISQDKADTDLDCGATTSDQSI
jgi:hypothetical protein